jgi:Secretion system C-terminal sorting domain
LSLEINQSDWQNGAAITPAQLTTLNELVDNHWMHRAGQKAMSYMNRHMGTQFYIPPARGGWQPRSAMLNNGTLLEIPIVEVYPNPANEIVTFEFHLSEQSQVSGTMAIYDITNRLVAELVIADRNQIITLDARQWQNGLYMFVVKIAGEEGHVGSFEIIH